MTTELLANGDVPVTIRLLDCGYRIGIAWIDAEGKRHGVTLEMPSAFKAHLDREFARNHGYSRNVIAQASEPVERILRG